MDNRSVDEKLNRAFEAVTPDIRDAVLEDCRKGNGKVLSMKEKPKKNKKKKILAWVAAAAAAVMLIAAVPFALKGFAHAPSAAASVMIDVNPSIELTVDKNERVIEAIPRNGDGVDLIDGMDLTGSNIKVALNAVIGSLVSRGYLNELANSMLISVDSRDEAMGARLLRELLDDVSALIGSSGFEFSVVSQKIDVDPAVTELASEYGITVSKAQLISKLMDADPSYEFTSLAALSINELCLLSGKKTPGGVNAIGEASSLAYIGEDEALSIALVHAGIAKDDAKNIDVNLDCENGIMVYEVEFDYDGYEYEYDIDAVSGRILEYEREPDNEPVNPTAAPAEPTAAPAEPTAAPALIGKSAALEKAIAHAGVSADKVYGTEVELDRDEGEYEVEFKCDGYEYEYEIDAYTGSVKHYEREKIDGAKPDSTNSPAEEYIGKRRALALAIEHAGVNTEDVYDKKVELERDGRKVIYEVEFKAAGYEYEYEIDAVTGKVLSHERERAEDHTTPAPTAKPTSSPTAKPTSSPTAKPTQKPSRIDRSEALAIALKDAGLTTDSVKKIEIELEDEDEKPYYEVEFEGNGFDYEYEIDAATGKILKRSKEASDDAPSTPPPSSVSFIGRDRAWEIALDRAGLTMSQIRDKEIELEHENGVHYYELEFNHGDYEYEVKINAVTGAIMRFHREIDD